MCIVELRVNDGSEMRYRATGSRRAAQEEQLKEEVKRGGREEVTEANKTHARASGDNSDI